MKLSIHIFATSLLTSMLWSCSNDQIASEPDQGYAIEQQSTIALVQSFYDQFYTQSRMAHNPIIVKNIYRVPSAAASRNSDNELTVAIFGTGTSEGYAILTNEGSNQEILYFTDNGKVDDIPDIAPLTAAFPTIAGTVIPGLPLDSLKLDKGEPSDTAHYYDVPNCKISPIIKRTFHHGEPYNIYNFYLSKISPSSLICDCPECSKNGGFKRNHIITTAIMNFMMNKGLAPGSFNYPPYITYKPKITGYEDLPDDILNDAWNCFRVNDALDIMPHCASISSPHIPDILMRLTEIYQQCFEVREVSGHGPFTYYTGVISINSFDDMNSIDLKIYNSLTENIPILVVKSNAGWNIDGFEIFNSSKQFHIVTCHDKGQNDGWINVKKMYDTFTNSIIILYDHRSPKPSGL